MLRRPGPAVGAYDDWTGVVARRPCGHAGDYPADAIFANSGQFYKHRR